ncbi:MAG: sugar transferase [Burkholderiaceae bacterium]|nr:sugar transferase [Burkholderiaceae bacterium]
MYLPETQQFAVKLQASKSALGGGGVEDERVRAPSWLLLGLKRVFDLASVVVILGLFWWVMIIVAVLIKLTSPGPLVFGHRRVGRSGRQFMCYKFRSMVTNSQEVLSELLERDPEARAEWARDFKLKNDPRVTRIGRFIRKTSLDELPQLWNVLVGDMSIVGPRPVVRKELALHYGPAGRRHYLSVRPGLTGLWQVGGRNDMNYSERVALDKRYVQTWTVFGDFWIVMRTVGVMFGKRGAY